MLLVWFMFSITVVFIMNSCLLFALVHVGLDLLLYFMFISFFVSLGLIWGFCILLLIGHFGWIRL